MSGFSYMIWAYMGSPIEFSVNSISAPDGMGAAGVEVYVPTFVSVPALALRAPAECRALAAVLIEAADKLEGKP